MSRKIHIEKLQIRLKNVSPEKARLVGKDLGGAILRQIAARANAQTGARHIEKLDAGRIETGPKQTASELQKQVAGRIAELIGGQTN